MSPSFDPSDHAERMLRESARIKLTIADTEGPKIAKVATRVAECFRAGRKVLLLGNGGSASDAQHIAAEWTGRLISDRPPLPAIALTSNTSDLTAIGNDYGFDEIFARLIGAHGIQGDVLLAISTSGNSRNVLAAVEEAQRKGIFVVGFTGKGGGKLSEMADISFTVPSKETGRIQECHIALLHAICEIVDYSLFPELRPK